MALGAVIATGGHHHLVGFDLAFAGDQAIARALMEQPRHGYPLAHIGLDLGSKAAHVLNNLLPAHEAFGGLAVVGKIGQAALPVGRYQAEGIPALLLPGVADAVLFQHQGPDAAPLQAAGHGEAGLAATHHHHGNPAGRGVTVHEKIPS